MHEKRAPLNEHSLNYLSVIFVLTKVVVRLLHSSTNLKVKYGDSNTSIV